MNNSQLQLAQLSTDVSRDELHGMSMGGDSSSGGGASPLTARSIRLERFAQALAHSQEELRRYVIFVTIYIFVLQLQIPFVHLYNYIINLGLTQFLLELKLSFLILKLIYGFWFMLF